MANYKAGQRLKFTYRGLKESIPGPPGDNFKEVLVLHPNWAGKMHAIDLKRLTPAEQEVLDVIMDPEQRGKPHRIPLVNDILRRMNPTEEIKNPMSFYSKFVKVFLRNKDAYRTYYPLQMSAVVISKQSKVSGKVINPKPLFHKVESKPKAPAPSRLDMIKAAAQKNSPATNKPSMAGKPAGVRSSKDTKAIKATPAKSATPAKKATPSTPPKMDRMALIKQRAELAKKRDS